MIAVRRTAALRRRLLSARGRSAVVAAQRQLLGRLSAACGMQVWNARPEIGHAAPWTLSLHPKRLSATGTLRLRIATLIRGQMQLSVVRLASESEQATYRPLTSTILHKPQSCTLGASGMEEWH